MKTIISIIVIGLFFVAHSYDYDLVLVGGGVLSFSLAKKVKSYNKKVLIIQPPTKDYTRWGFAFPVLKEKAKINLKLKRSVGVGFSKVNFSELNRTITELIIEIKKNSIENAITYLEGIPEIMSNHSLQIGEDHYTFKTLFLFPEFEYFYDDRAHFNTAFITPQTLFDCTVIPESLVVIDTGDFGIEYATLFSLLGAKVVYITNKEKIISGRFYEFEKAYLEFFKEHSIDYFCATEVIGTEYDSSGKIKVFCKEQNNKFVIYTSQLFVTGQAVPTFKHVDKNIVTFTDYVLQKKSLLEKKNSLLSFIDVNDPSHMYGIFKIRHFLELLGYEQPSLYFDSFNFFKTVTVFPTVPTMIHIGITEQEAFAKYGSKIKIFRESLDIVEQFQLELGTRGFIKVVCLPTGKILGVKILAEKAAEIAENISFDKPLQKAYQDGISNAGTFWTYLEILERVAYQSYFYFKLSYNNNSQSWINWIKQWIAKKLRS